MASKNEDVHLRLFFDGAKAAKTYDLLTTLQEEYNKKMEEAKKIAKSKGIDPKNDDDTKYWKGKLTIIKSMLKEAKKSYSDVHNALSNLSKQSMADLNAYAKYLEHRMNSLSMKKKGSAQEYAKLKQEYDQIDAERKSRNGTSQNRTLAEIQKDLQNSNLSIDKLRRLRQELDHLINFTTSSNTRNAAVKELGNLDARLKQMNAQPLRDLQSVLANIANANNGSIERLKQLREELVRIQQTSTNSADVRTASQAIADLDKRIADMTKIPPRSVSAVLGDIANTKSIEGLEKLKSEITALYKTSTNSGDQQRLAQGLRDVDAAIKKIGEAPKRPLAAVIGDIDAAMKNGSLERLEALRVEIGNVFRSLSDKSDAQKARAKMEQLDLVIKNFGKETVDALAVLRNPQNFNISQVTAAISQLKEKFDNLRVGKALDPVRKNLADNINFLKAYVENAKAALNDPAMTTSTAIGFARGGDATLTQLREAVKVLTEFRDKNIKTSDTAGIREYNKYIEDLNARIKQASDSQRQLMGVDLARGIAQGVLIGTVADLKEAKTALEQFKSGLQTTDTTQLKAVNNELKSLDQMLKEANGDAKQLMDKTQAEDAVRILRSLIASARVNPAAVGAEAMKSAIAAAKEAQSATGISIRLSQEAVAAEREATEMMRAKNLVILESSTITKAETDAQNLLREGTSANAAQVRDTISLYQQLVQQENIDIAKKREYEATLKQLEALYKQGAQARLDASAVEANAQSLITQGANAEVSAVNKIIEDLRVLQKQEGVTAGEAQRFADKIAQLESLTKRAGSEARNLAYDEKFVADTLKSIKTTPADNLEKAMLMLRNRMNDSKTSLKEYVKASTELKKVQANVRGINDQLKSQETFFAKSITKLASYLGIFGGFYLVRQKMTQAFQANMKYDESLTNIRKTTGLTSESVAMLAENIKRINTRTILQDMNDLAYAAGKLGVKGASDVMGFVRSADQIKIALGEQLGDSSEAVEQLMKITSIMGVQQQFGLEGALKKVGSSLNYLTMNSQATAQPIVDFMKRIAGVSTQAGVTASELAGLAAAVSALGQPVEMSATSISKMMVQISGHSKQIASALKMTNQEADDFMYKISSGQMMDALLTVLQKTNEAGGLSHLSTIVKDLGSNGQRVIQTIATLSENYDMVAKMVRMSNQAFNEGTSVTNEYNIKQENTAALYEKLKNNISKLFVSTEAVDLIRGLLLSLQSFPETLRNITIHFEPMLDVLKGFVWVLTNATPLVTGFISAMMWNAVLSKAVFGIQSFVASVAKIPVVFKAATSSVNGFFTFLRSASFGNIFTLVLTGILTLININKSASDEARRSAEESIELLERTKNQSATTTASIEAMISKLKQANEGTEERKQIIDQLNATYGTYLGHQFTEKMNNDAIAESLRQVNKELRLKALLEGQTQMIEDVESKYRDKRGLAKTSLIDTIAGIIKPGENSSKSAARSVAAVVAERLLEMQSDGTRYGSTLVNARKDEDGNILSYFTRLYVGGSDNSAVEQAQNAVRQLIQNAINDYTKDHPGSDLSSTGKSQAILESVVDYLNIEAKKDAEIRQKNVAWNDDIAIVSEQAKDQVIKDVKEYWDAISETVTQSGKFATTFVSEDYKSKDKEPWVKKKDQMTPQQRQEEENMVKGFLNRIDDYMSVVAGEGRRFKKGMKEVEANETDEYKELRARQHNAEQYLRVLEVGKIENAPDKNADSKARREGSDEYKNIIAKVEEFYKVQAAQLEQNMLDGKMTKYAYEDAIKENEKQLNISLASVRDAIDGDDKGEKVWFDRIIEMIRSNIAGESGDEVLNRIRATYDVRSIGLKLNAGSDEDRAIISGMKKEAEENRRKALKVDVDRYEKELQAMLERNPIGKITDDYLEQFQQMGLMFANLSSDSKENLRSLCQDVMSVYLQLGKTTVKFDVTSAEGLKAYRDYVSQLPHIGEAASKASDEKLRSLYYETYQYAETYSESVSKLIEKQRKVWDKMYSQTQSHINSVARQADISRAMSGATISATFSNGLNAKLAAAQRELSSAESNDDFNAIYKAEQKIDRITSSIEEAAEQYNEAKERLEELIEERQMNIEIGVSDKDLDKDIAAVEKKLAKLEKLINGDGNRFAISFGSNQLTSYGGSKRMAMMQDVELKQEKLNDATSNWQSNIQKAKNKVSARQQDYDNAMSNANASESDRAAALNELDLAKQQLDLISQMPDSVRTATDAMAESMMNLAMETRSWASEMEQSFETFMDGIVPFRSWYEDNGSLADNIFGTKEERQEAFGGFMDTLKKTIRNSIVEYTRLRVQKSVQDKMQTLGEKIQERTRGMFHKERKAEEVAVDLAADQTSLASSRIKTTQEEAMSNEGTSVSMANKATETTGNVLGNMAQAVSKAFADLGPIAGAVAAGVVSAAIGAVLTMAMNALGGGRSKSSSVSTKTKLVSGMLTYDSGNVQSFPVMGDDGRVYSVSRVEGSLGTGMVTRPTLTTIAGRPSLVGERGPEMVIGRETTHAMQMSRPDLIRQILEFDRNRSRGFAKTFDSGNLSSMAIDSSDGATDGQMSRQQLAELLDANTAMMAQMADVNNRLAAELNRGIGVRKYGTGGLIEEVADGLAEAKRMKNNHNVNRLFASR